MHLESLIENVGGFGLFQVRLVPLLSCFKIIAAPSMLMMAFAGVEPDWWCQPRDETNVTLFVNMSYKNCEWNSTCERRYDNAMVTVVSQWDLACEGNWIVNTIISIQMSGVFIGAIITGHCSDTYGRKKILYSGVLLSTVGNLVAAFSTSWIMFTVLRFLLGVSSGMSLPVIYLYQTEFVGKKWRGFVASLPSFTTGVVLFAVLAWTVHNWKWMHLALAVASFLMLLSWWIVPESLRWLTVKGHLEQARQVVNRMATANRKRVPDTSILELIADEERDERNKARNYTYIDLFRSRNLARRTVLTCFVWFSLSVIYYAISFGVKNLSGDFYLNFMIMALIELPSFPATLILMYLFDRRTAAAVFFLLSTVCAFGVAIAARIQNPSISLAFTRLLLNKHEIMIRNFVNLAYSAQNTAARVGGIIAAQLLSLGAKNDLMPPFVALGILMCLTALSCFTLEETRKKALEDTMKTYMEGNPTNEMDEKQYHNEDNDEKPVGLEVKTDSETRNGGKRGSSASNEDVDIAK